MRPINFCATDCCTVCGISESIERGEVPATAADLRVASRGDLDMPLLRALSWEGLLLVAEVFFIEADSSVLSNGLSIKWVGSKR